MMRAVDSGRHRAIVAWAADRPHRRPIELEAFIDAVNAAGVKVHMVRVGEVDLTTPSGRANARMLGVWARLEVEQKSDRRRRAAQQKARRGGMNGGGRSFGYGRTIVDVTRWEEDADGRELPRTRTVSEEPERVLADEEREETVTRRSGRRVQVRRRRKSLDFDGINEPEAAAIRAAFEAIASYKRTTTSIWTEWNERGLRTPFGNEWTGTTLRKMLLRPSLAGVVTYAGLSEDRRYASGRPKRNAVEMFEDVPASWPAIVGRKTWQAVVDIVTAPERRKSPGPTPKHLCGGITFCGAEVDGEKCGRKMKSAVNSIKSKRTGERHNFPVYRCSAGGSGHASIKMDLLDAKVVDESELLRTRYKPEASDPIDDERLAEIQHRLRELDESEELLADLVLDGTLSRQAVRKKTEAMKVERVALVSERERITRSVSTEGAGEAFAALWEGLDLDGPGPESVDVSADEVDEVFEAVGRGLIAAMERGGMEPEEARARLAMEERFEGLPLVQRRALVSSLLTVTVHRGSGPDRVVTQPMRRR